MRGESVDSTVDNPVATIAKNLDKLKRAVIDEGADWRRGRRGRLNGGHHRVARRCGGRKKMGEEAASGPQRIEERPGEKGQRGTSRLYLTRMQRDECMATACTT